MTPQEKKEALAEAYGRGILPEDKKAQYDEAMRRGLVPQVEWGSRGKVGAYEPVGRAPRPMQPNELRPQASTGSQAPTLSEAPEVMSKGGPSSLGPLPSNGIINPNAFAPANQVMRAGFEGSDQIGEYEKAYTSQGWELLGRQGEDYVFRHPRNRAGEPFTVKVTSNDVVTPQMTPDHRINSDSEMERAFAGLDFRQRQTRGEIERLKNRTYWDRVSESNPLETGAAIAAGVNSLFTGNMDDEIMSLVGVDGYGAEKEYLREKQPGAFMGGQGIAGMTPIGGALRLPQAQGVRGAAATGATVGAAEGALLGFGDGDDINSRLSLAREGALYGGAAGGVLGGGIRGAEKTPEMVRSFVESVSPAELRAFVSDFAGSGRNVAQIRAEKQGFGQTLDAELEVIPNASGKSLGVLNRLLRKSGLTPDDITRVSKVVQDFELDGSQLALGRRTLAERYYDALGAENFPQAQVNLLAVLREGGMLSGGRNLSSRITSESVGAGRKSQADFLEGRTREAFGGASQLSQRDDIIDEMRRIGDEEFDRILRRGFTDPAQEQIVVNRLQNPIILGALRRDAAFEGLDLDAYISRNPAAAAHWIQSYAGSKADELAGTREGVQWAKLREQFVDPLRRGVPEYRDAQLLYADEAAAKRATGMGDRFLTLAKDETKLDQFKRDFDDLPDNAKPAALASVRNALIRKTRAGSEGGSVRLGELRSRGNLNALEYVFGSKGKALADDIRALDKESQFFNYVDPEAQSRTYPNAVAMKVGEEMTSGNTYNMLNAERGTGTAIAGDVMLSTMADSVSPLFTTAKATKGVLKNIARTGPRTRNEFTSLLMSRRDGALDIPVPARQLPGPSRGGYVPDGNRALNTPLGQSVRPSELYDPQDPMNPAGRGLIPGGVEEGRYVSPLEAADREAVMAIRNLNAPQQVTRRNRFNTSKSARVPDWDGPIPERPTPLTEWVKRKGGVNDEGGEISSILGGTNIRPGVISNLKRGGQFSISGRSIDDMTQAAIEEGYLPQGSSANDFLDALADDGRDSSVFPIYLRDTNDIYEWQAYVDWAKRAGVETPYEAARTAREKRKAGKTGGLFSGPKPPKPNN